MKKILSYLLIAVLALSLFSGCKKKDEIEEVDLEQPDVQSQMETVDAAGDTETKEEAQEDVEYILYLRYKDKPFLYDEYFTVNINDEGFKDKSMEEFIIEQLINYEPKGEFISPVPEGTKLLSIEREDNNVIINLSKDFKEKKMSSSDAMLAVGGIVNSVVAVPGNETAQIIVEGEALESFNGVKVSEPMFFLEGLFPDK